jgi:glycerophosphoryl diester phosphodiesterase
MELIAHRGIPRLARENTLDSFALALEAGADGIELDVHISADAVVVVHHDDMLGNSGAPIAELSAVELARSGIPSLAEVCRLVATRARLYVEAKAPRSAAPIVECLAAHEVRAAVHSFDDRIIRAVRTLAPGLPIGLLLSSEVSDPAAIALGHGVRDLWPLAATIAAKLVTEVHRVGARVIAWTVNDEEHARALEMLGVDGICTDDVRRLQPALLRRGRGIG